MKIRKTEYIGSIKRSGVGQLSRFGERPFAGAAGLALAALATSALVNHRLGRKAERQNPPQGRFIEVDGVRLHYLERGKGEPLVLLHGNGSMIQDFDSSGLLEEAARRYRVIAFDRPGYGHSERPRGRVWSPVVQAELIHKALEQLGATPAVVLGHSWGTLVAVALGAKHASGVKALVLASGYFYPTARADVVAASAPAVSIVGDILRYTLAPIVTRMAWPRLMRKIFGPAEEPRKFKREFPKGLSVRPSQLRASAEESALMIPSASELGAKYGELSMPVVIIAGEGDRLIDTAAQSARLHRNVRHSSFHSVPGSGHMVHQTAMNAVMGAIDEAVRAASGKPGAEAVPSAA